MRMNNCKEVRKGAQKSNQAIERNGKKGLDYNIDKTQKLTK